jgi:hypothetical protein
VKPSLPQNSCDRPLFLHSETRRNFVTWHTFGSPNAWYNAGYYHEEVFVLRGSLYQSGFRPLFVLLAALALVLAACGGDDTDDDATESAADPEPTPTAVATVAEEPTATPEPEAEPTVVAEDDDASDAEPEPTAVPTEPPAEPTPEPDPDVELAPELAGLTDWRNTDPVTLEDLRGSPVVLVFWNSI